MPLIHKEENNDLIAGIWHVTESDAYFEEHMQLFPLEVKEISLLKNRKKSEWLASRYLLHTLSKRKLRGACLKDQFGKPYLEGSSWYISMSHSADYVAVAASPSPVGVDIQLRLPKIYRIAPRFLNENELKMCEGEKAIDYMHILWGAKECVYKAYGRKEVDFRKHIRIDFFNHEAGQAVFTGSFRKDEQSMKFIFHSKTIENFIFVYGISN